MKNYPTPLMVAILLSGCLGGALSRISLKAPDSNPVAIMDRGHFLKGLDQATSPEDKTIAVKRFESAARRLADAGYLVIDRGWVIAAPEHLYVDTDE